MPLGVMDFKTGVKKLTTKLDKNAGKEETFLPVYEG